MGGWAARDPRQTPLALAPGNLLTALTLRTVFRLACWKTEGLIGFIVDLLGLEFPVPNHATLSRRSAMLDVPRPTRSNIGADGGTEPLHLVVDSTGVELCGPGEWLAEKHGTRTRRSWRKLHLGPDAGTGQIVAASLTAKEVDDGAEVGALRDQVDGAVAAVIGDGGYDQDGVYASVGQRHPNAAVVVPPRTTAVLSETAKTAPTQRDCRLQHITEQA